MPKSSINNLSLVCIPDHRLSIPSLKVESFDYDLSKLSKKLEDLMYLHKGVGFAAVQAGVHLRMFVAKAGETTKVFVNPEVLAASSWYTPHEGCLSIPGSWETPLRPHEVFLRYQDLKGAQFTESFTGLLAEIVSHELDHLDGLTLKDRLVLGRGVGSRSF